MNNTDSALLVFVSWPEEISFFVLPNLSETERKVLKQSHGNLGNTRLSKTAQTAVDKISASITAEKHMSDSSYFLPETPQDWRCKWDRYRVDHATSIKANVSEIFYTGFVM